MNRINPARAAIFIIVLAAAAITIYFTLDHFRQKAEQKRQQHQLEIDTQAAAQKAAQDQQKLEKDRAVAAQQAASDAAAAAQKAAQDAVKEHADFLARYTNINLAKSPGTEMVAIAVADENGKMNHTIGAALVNHFKGERLKLTDSFFKPALVSDGLFNDAYNGSSDLFNKLELAKSLDALLLAKQDVQYSTNATLDGMVTANMNLEMVALPVAGQIQSQEWKLMAAGVGTGTAEARELAEERIINQISTDTNMTFIQIQ